MSRYYVVLKENPTTGERLRLQVEARSMRCEENKIILYNISWGVEDIVALFDLERVLFIGQHGYFSEISDEDNETEEEILPDAEKSDEPDDRA